jgi:hypothetical protein
MKPGGRVKHRPPAKEAPMTPARFAAALIVAAAVPSLASAAALCDQLGKAVAYAKTGFGPVEGDALTSNDNQYWRSTIQLSDGDNCAIEGHKILTCSWEPSTPADLKKMVASIAACFPDAQQNVTKTDDDSPPQTTFKLDEASIDVGLTADVLSLDVGP